MNTREFYIGGSDIAAVIGLNKYCSRLKLFNQKKGNEKVKENESMYWGKVIESVILNEFEVRNGIELVRDEQFFLEGDDRYGCQVDGYNDDEGILVDAKNVGEYSKSEWDEKPPILYYCQMQWNMGITGFRTAYLCALVGGKEYRQFEISFNAKLFEQMLDAAKKFMTLLENDQEPSAEVPDDLKFLHHSKEVKPSTEVLDKLAMNLAHINSDMKLLKSQKDSIEDTIKLAIGESQGIRALDWKCNYKTAKAKEEVDWESIAKEILSNPDLDISKIKPDYTTVKPGSRRFSFTHNFTLGG